MTSLVAMSDADFAWLLGDASGDGRLAVAPGGIAPREVIAMLRDVATAVGDGAAHPVSWLILDHNEVVGMIGLTRRLPEGGFEFGYGVAPAREGRGHATAAVAALLAEARRLGIGRLTAETSVANPGSQRVLEKNGFRRSGPRHDADDGELMGWVHDDD